MQKFNISNEDENKTLKNLLFKSFQSCNINFLFGAGTSYPAISTLGNIENDVQELINNDKEPKANEILVDFLEKIYETTTKINLTEQSDSLIEQTKTNYKNFIFWLNKILLNRKNEITKSTANIFTTNYDLFLEYACEQVGSYFNYNDGFSCKNKFFKEVILDVSEFNKKISYCTNLYKHNAILPNVNIVKLHGSLNWEIDNGTKTIILSNIFEKYDEICKITKSKKRKNEDIANCLNSIGLVTPTKAKFQKTVLEQSYYNFLRFFSNELEKENGILFAIGFSFEDEHIRDLINKVLSINPTLHLYICAFNKTSYESFEKIFSEFNNVTLIYDDEKDFSFSDCNQKLNIYFEDLMVND